MKKTLIAVAVGLIIVGLIISFGQIFTVRYINVNFDNAVCSASKEEIISVADIDTHTNIFVLEEKELIKKIENNFPDNAIKVKDVIRHFPNTVNIVISERTALFKIAASVGEENGFVTADKDFQRTYIYSEEAISDKVLVTVSGVTVTGTYNIAECKALKEIADTMLKIGFKEEAIPYFIKSIDFNGNDLIITTRSDGAVFMIPSYTEGVVGYRSHDG